MCVPVFIMLAAGTLAYSNSLSGLFVFDGALFVEENVAFRTLWPLWAPMIGTGRPIVAWSFAVNYALGGTNAWGYHVVNLVIHLAAALVLFGVVRRTLSSRRLAARFGSAAWGLALAVAVLWLVHPLQTQSVTYIYQRYESLMGLFILLTLYGFIRAQDASHPNRWYIASATCCLLAAMSKEVAAVVPLLVLWYDRALVASSGREIVRRRWAYYAGLAGTWPILAGFMLSQAHGFAAAGVLVVKNLTPWQYAVTQPGVLVHYLRLCFWPTGLCIDYGWPVAATLGAIIPPLLLIVALLALTIWAIFRWPEWSFVGAWFFLILAPTSSVFPIRDLAFEHRMYLPLAAVVASVVIGGYLVGRWLVRSGRVSRPALQMAGVSLLILTAVALGVLTFDRNADYRDQMSIWGDTVSKTPGNERARNNLGAALLDCGRSDEATLQFEAALGINPDYADAQKNLGIARSQRGKILKALVAQRESLLSRPDDIRLLNDAAWTLATNPNASIRNSTEAIALAQRAVQLSKEQEPAVLGTLAAAYAEAGRFSEAVETAHKAAKLAAEQSKQPLAESIRAKIPLYEAGTPVREMPQSSAATSTQP